MHLAYAIIFVSDMNRSILFYRDIVGLPLKFASPEWTEFETGAATIALHLAEQPNPDMDTPQKEPAGRCRPGIQVANLDEFHQRMVANSVPCAQEPKSLFGTRIAQYIDPDGLTFSVSQARQAD